MTPSHSVEARHHTRGGARFAVQRCSVPMLLLWGALAVGCGAVDEFPEASPLTGEPQELGSNNGLSTNGLSANGLSANGLSANGLSANGLSLNGLNTESFRTWFQANRPLSESVMRYLILCAVPSGQSRTFTDAVTGESFTWSGGLGVAPDWANGRPATVAEQQLVSACMAAHVNKFGMRIPLSVLGRNARNEPIPYTSWELSTYSHKEACFFGNLFTREGIYLGNDRGNLSARESSARACSISSNAENMRTTDCPPLNYVGSCTNYCTLDASKTYFTSCRYNGVTYKPITTRLREEDIYTCGDGVCQITESCGNSNQYYNCGLDCGPCQ
jgi:hypothetical protein